jgi:hypothetical protein
MDTSDQIPDRDPRFGAVRRVSLIDLGECTCSICDAPIPEDSVPLIAFGEGNRAYVWCDTCAEEWIIPLIQFKTGAAQPRHGS